MSIETANKSLGIDHRGLERFRNVLMDGRRWALELGQSEMGVELALIGLTYDLPIQDLLGNFGVDASSFRKNVKNSIQVGNAQPLNPMPITEDLKSAINSAVRMADVRRSNLIGTPDLLKAIINLKNPIVEEALEVSGIEWVDLLRLTDPNTSAQTRLKLTRARLNNLIDHINRNPLDYSSETMNEFSSEIQRAMGEVRPLQKIR